MVTAESIRDKEQIKALADYFWGTEQASQPRNVCYGCPYQRSPKDPLADVYDLTHGRFRTHMFIREQKSGKAKTVALNRHAFTFRDV